MWSAGALSTVLLVSLDDDDSIENCSVLDRMVDSMFDVQYDTG